jgi:Na+-driven multidrug efflux pump
MLTAFEGIADSLWVAKTLGEEGVSVLGAVFIVEFLAINVAVYLMSAMDTHLGFLFGEGRGQEGSQLFVDFIRVAALLGVLVPALVLPLTTPLVMWFGADSRLAGMCLQYMLPTTICCFFKFLFMIGGGVVMACGSPGTFAVAQISAFVLKVGILDPLFLLGCKTPIWGASLATAITEAIVGVSLALFVWFSERFSLHPTMSMFVGKFGPETCTGLKVGIPALISNMSYSLPLLLCQKYLDMAATAIGAYEDIVAVWAVLQKIEELAYGIAIAIATALAPATAYAFGAKRFKRVFWLFVHATWLGALLPGIATIPVIFWPGKVALIWDSDAGFVRWCQDFFPRAFYGSILVGYQYMAASLMQSLHFLLRASLHSVLTDLLPWPVFASIMYYTGKSDPARLMWIYLMSDVYSAVVTTLFLITPFKMLLADTAADARLTAESEVAMSLEEEETAASDGGSD